MGAGRNRVIGRPQQKTEQRTQAPLQFCLKPPLIVTSLTSFPNGLILQTNTGQNSQQR